MQAVFLDVHWMEVDDPAIHAINVDAEFQSRIPPISDDERAQLERNIVEVGGVRDPLTVWLRGDDDWVLLDGHNRLEICKRLRLPFTYHQVEYDTREEAADWIDRNQLGRRNLSAEGRKLLIGRVYNRAKKAEHDGGKGKPRSGGHADRHSEKTSERIAREHGVGEATVRRAGKFHAAAAKLNIEQEIVTGEIKASEAEIITAAAALPAEPTPRDVEQARKAVKTASGKRGKGKQPDKPTAADTRRKNAGLADKLRRSLVTLRHAVESLAETDSAYRDEALAELQRHVVHLTRHPAGAAAKSVKRQPDDQLRTAVMQRWNTMRECDKHWGIADMKDVRRLFIDVIREEQKQFDK